MRQLLGIILFIVPALVHAVEQTPIQQPSDDNLRLLEVYLDKIHLEDIVTAYQYQDRLVVPLGALCQILDLAITVQPNKGIAEGFILQEDRRFYLDAARGEVTLSGKSRTYPRDAVVVYPDDIYIDINQLSRWLPLTVDADLFSAIIRIHPKEPFPVQLRMAREKRMAQTRSRYRPEPRDYPKLTSDYQLWSVPFIDQSVGLLTQNSDELGDSQVLNYTTYATADLLFMESSMYLLGSSEDGLDDYRLTFGRKDPSAQLFGPLQARAVGLGHISVPGIRLITRSKAAQLGASAHSYPLTQQLNYDSHTFEGSLLPGWQVELYHNNALIDYQPSAVNGLYRFEDVPLLFGNNYMRLVFYGPHGETREETQTFFVGSALTQPGQQYYRISSSRDEDTDVEQSLLQYDLGINKYLSAHMNLVSLTVAGLQHQYAAVGVTGFWQSLFMNLEMVDDADGGAANELSLQTKVSAFNIKLSHAELDDFESELFLFGDAVTRRTQFRLDTAIPQSFLPRLPVTFEVNKDQFDSGNHRRELYNRISGFSQGVAVSNELLYIDEPGSDRTGNGTFAISYHRSGYNLRSDINYQLKPSSDLTVIAINYEGFYIGSFRVGLGYVYAPDSDDQYLFGLNKRKGRYALSLNTVYKTNGDISLNLLASFSLGRDPTMRNWHSSAQPMANLSSISATAFLDDNQNGIKEPAEQGLPNVALAFNGSRRPSQTNEQGQLFVTQVPVHQALDVSVAIDSLEDPLWVPAVEGVQFVPRPGKVTRLMFPIVMTGEIDGTTYLKTEDKERYVGDVEIQLVDAKGRVINRTRSAYDGFYVMSKVPVGEYTLRVSPDQTERLGLVATKTKIVTITADNLFINAEDFVLRQK